MKYNELLLIIKELSLKFLQTYPIILPIYTLIISFLLNNMQWFFFACCSLITLLLVPIWKYVFRLFYEFIGRKSLPLLGSGSRPSGKYDCSGFTYCSSGLATNISYGMPSGHSLVSWMISTYLILYVMMIEYDNMYFYLILKVIILILLAICVSGSRYINGYHTIQQIIVGTLIGIGMGFMFFYIMKASDLFKNKKIYVS